MRTILCRAGEHTPEFGIQTSDIAGQRSPKLSSTGKVMFTVLGYPILEHYQERGTAVYSAPYSEGSGARVPCRSTKHIFFF